MKLIVFTGHYPFKPGEEFFDDEIKVLSNNFDKILVVSGEKNINKYRSKPPQNVEVVVVNRNYDIVICLFTGFIKMFSLESIKEILYTKKVLDNKIGMNVLKTLFIYNAVSVRLVRWITKNISKDKTNIVLYSYWLSTGSYALTRLKKKGYQFIAIARAHGGDAFLDRGYQAYRNIIYKNLDEIHFVSETAKEQFYQKVILPKDSTKAKLFTSRLGTEKTVKVLNPIKIKDSIFHIVTCSSIISLKRLDLLVEAIRITKGIKIKWTHFGDGYLREAILHQIEEKLDKDKAEIKFVGQVKNEQIHEFYKKNHVDIFVNMSDYEGIPVSIMEAISYGIPIIARDIGGNSEIVFNKLNGILLPALITPMELANAIEHFYNLSLEEIFEYRDSAYRIWQELYNASKNYNVFANHIKELMGN